MAHHMNKQYFAAISPIMKDSRNHEAFLAIIEFEKDKIIHALETPKTVDELVVLHSKYLLLHHLSRLRDVVLEAEKNYAPSNGG